ncbi:ATP-grasp domain-containing protein [Treponema denticola]|uniref:ATP-grasp domain-containing protein n=1 Tax=Treponema denticola TaxID=158 RepID=A0A9Q9BML2_TREDN|nr:ATP-grasp domain-containing protein [Treponema denticola]UTC90139.1 ATP-grasp domain-containing protein [Treponema denticola]UTD00509.1 ATP-grasp domain-containing protein [Treponema denticola]UTD05338.1 ATP-grasp domain-containing protein [Treponema denticola]
MKENKKRILILGAGLMQGPAIRAAKELGCEVIAVDGNPNAVCAKEADKFFPIDLKDIPALIDLAKSLKEKGLHGVFTAATDFSVSVAAIAESCSLPGHSLEAARRASDKVLMRESFEKHGVPSPKFTHIFKNEIDKALQILKQKAIPFPLTVKPADNMGARGCRLVYSQDELRPSLEDAVNFSRSGKAIAEEFIDGEEFSLEALVINGEIFLNALADRHIFFPPYFVEMGHTIPSIKSKEECDELIRVFFLGIKALGLTNGAAKGDIFLRKADPKKNGKRTACVGEIAARLSGGYMSGWTVPYSSGFDVTKAAVKIALGEPVDELPNSEAARFSAERAASFSAERAALFSAERAWISVPGIIKKIYGLEEARSTKNIKDVLPRLFEKDEAVFPKNNVEKCGNVLSSAESYDEAVKASMEAVQKIFLRLERANNKTNLFFEKTNPSIAVQGNYPPNFFKFPEDDSTKEIKNKTFDELLKNSILKEEDEILYPSFFKDFLDKAFDVHGLSIREAIKQAFFLEPNLKEKMLILQTIGEPLNQSLVLWWKYFIRGSRQGLIYYLDTELND